MNGIQFPSAPFKLEELLDFITEFSRFVLERNNTISTQYFLGNQEEGIINPVIMNMPDELNIDQQKEFSINGIKHILKKELQIDIVLCISDAYYITSEKSIDFDKLYDQYGSIKDTPGRKECILIILETRNGRKISKMIPYNRLKNNFIEYEEANIIDNKNNREMIDGRMADFFEHSATIQ